MSDQADVELLAQLIPNLAHRTRPVMMVNSRPSSARTTNSKAT